MRNAFIAASLSYTFGEYVSVISSDPVENPYYEWWCGVSSGRLDEFHRPT
jgi:hypothetical protein